MPKKRGKGKARLIAQPAEESIVGPSPTDIFAVSQPLKVCRLCESKNGPFLNIFEADKVIAKKIEELMPFGVAENDDLPHKICFRCSAKVEELHEFIQKCIKTQINLRTSLGKKEPFIPKLKTNISLWEEKLNKSNMSNHDICDAVIKKAMEGIKDLPINPLDNSKDIVKSDPSLHKTGNETVKNKPSEITKLIESSKEIIDIESDGNAGDESKLIRNTKMARRNSTSMTLRSNIESLNHVATSQLPSKPKPTSNRRLSVDSLCVSNDWENPIKSKTTAKRASGAPVAPPNKKIKLADVEKDKTNSNHAAKNSFEKPREQDGTGKEQTSEFTNIKTSQSNQKDNDNSAPNAIPKPAINEKPFDIMDHVSMIKVNGVGVLFQCKLCNRNFLKMDFVQTHSCAKNRCVPKENVVRKPTPPEPPRPPTVKYINTKLGNDPKKMGIPESSNCSDKTDSDTKSTAVTEGIPVKPKPRIGPASRVKRDTKDSAALSVGTKNNADEGPSGKKQNNTSGTISLPPTPNLNCPYKLVPGPNNTFTLVEETQEHNSKTKKPAKRVQESQNFVEIKSKQRQAGNDSNYVTVRKTNTLVFESEETDVTKQALHKQPYPVGIFQTVPKMTAKTPPAPHTAGSLLFSATAAQKQSYSIVQTGNPSKLLISAKPQQRAEEPVKRARKTKLAPVTQQTTEGMKPLSLNLDDASRPIDPDSFNILNIDPLLTPSYVLPIPNKSQSVTMNNAQSDSTAHLLAGSNGHYTCNMCNEVFTREQKLLAHIHSHYNKMDEEDTMRVSKTNRKRGKKS